MAIDFIVCLSLADVFFASKIVWRTENVVTKKGLKKVFSELQPGDLICVDWCDASVGKSSSSGVIIDIPVRSWGLYVGLFGQRTKHIVLAQNSFCYSDGLYDLDYTAIPTSWALDVLVLLKGHIPADIAQALVNSFVLGGHRASNHNRTFQRRLAVHEHERLG